VSESVPFAYVENVDNVDTRIACVDVHAFMYVCMRAHVHSTHARTRTPDMRVCATAYIHTYVHTHKHAYIQTYKHTYIHTNIHTYIQTYIHTYIHTRTRMHAYDVVLYIHTYLQWRMRRALPGTCGLHLQTSLPRSPSTRGLRCICPPLPTHTHTHRQTDTYVHTCTHAHTQAHTCTHVQMPALCTRYDTCTHTHTHTHTRTHSHKHTHMHPKFETRNPKSETRNPLILE